MKFGLPTFLKRTKKPTVNGASNEPKAGGVNPTEQQQSHNNHKQQPKRNQFQQPKHKGTFYTQNKSAPDDNHNNTSNHSPLKGKKSAQSLRGQDVTAMPMVKQEGRWIHVGEPLPAPIFPNFRAVFSATPYNSNGSSSNVGDASGDNKNTANDDFFFITVLLYAPQTMENACVREIRQINPDIVILRDAAWVQVLRSLGYRTHGHIHYRPDKFAVYTIKGQSTAASVVTNDAKSGSTSSTSNSGGGGSVNDARESLVQHHQRDTQAAVVLQHLKTWDRIIVSGSGNEQAGVVDLAARFQPVQGTSRNNNKLCTPVIIAGSEPTRLQSPLQQQKQPQQQNQAQSCLTLKETSGFWYSDTTLALEEYLETPQGNEFAVRFRLRTGISSQYHNRYLSA
jgi:hypothetical protein